MKTTKQKYTVDTQLEIKEHKHTTEENNESTREKAKDSVYINRDRPQIKEGTFFPLQQEGLSRWGIKANVQVREGKGKMKEIEFSYSI